MKNTHVKALNIFNQYQLMIKLAQQSNPLMEREDITERFGFIGDALISEICRLMGWNSDDDKIFGLLFKWIIVIDDGDFETLRLIVEEAGE